MYPVVSSQTQSPSYRIWIGAVRVIPFLILLLASGFVAAQSVVTQTIPSEPITDWSHPAFWESYDGQPVELGWEFADEEVRLVRPRGRSGSLLSPPLSSNFELSFEWKINQKSNSGLKYRVRQFDRNWLGLEYQIIHEDKLSTSKGSTASIYDLVAPIPEKPLKPSGQWNRSRIVAIGNRIEHHLNGTLTAVTTTTGVPWDVMIAKSKFWGLKGFGQPGDKDRVMLTDHGGKASFRNFKFVAHTAPQEQATQNLAPQLGNAMRNSWADQTSIVLWTRTTARKEMVTDGPRFITLTNKENSKYSKLRDSEKLNALQLPEGAKLSEMFGASPGAPGEVRLTYFPPKQRNRAISTPWVKTFAKNDFTAQWKLEKLKPGREYAVVIEAKPIGEEQPTAVIRGSFRTAPASNKQDDLKFCVTTCHDFPRRDDGANGHKIYPSMTEIAPDFVVHAGDIEYYDKPNPWAFTEELMRFKWQRIFSLPSNREFYKNHTTYFIKDDHDTLDDDCSAGDVYGSVSFERGLQIFNEEQFPSNPVRYQTVHWGKDVQIWILEGRDFRSPNSMPDGPEKSILGVEQKAWLKETLSESKATFKLIFSPTPIVGPDRNNKKDNHANEIFAHEGQELREEFAKHEGLIVFCGDRHWQYASVDEETGVWEFGCGPGSEKHQFGWKKGDKRPVHRFLRVDGGFLSGEVKYGKRDSPKLTLQHRSVTGEVVSEFEFPVTKD